MRFIESARSIVALFQLFTASIHRSKVFDEMMSSQKMTADNDLLDYKICLEPLGQRNSFQLIT